MSHTYAKRTNGARPRRLAGRTLSLVAAVATIAAMSAPTANADTPSRLSYDIDGGFLTTILSQYCGFDVVYHQAGTVSAMSVETGAGVLEMDIAHGTGEFINPETGSSVDYHLGPTQYSYPEGVYVGAPAVVSVFGQFMPHAPGYAQVAGRIVYDTVVVAVYEGFGVIDLSSASESVVASSGSEWTRHFRFFAQFDSVCAALAS